MGGAQLLPALLGESLEEELGDEIREAREEEYGRLIGEVAPLEGSTELVAELKDWA